MEFTFISRIADIGHDTWDALWATDYPFLQYAFLHALEYTGCTTRQSGWQPHHLVVSDHDSVIGLMPLYVKTHSYGEYVFDWAWADAYHRYGLDYYPKLLTAIPFTPATGPRIALASGYTLATLAESLTRALAEECRRLGASSWHCLFPEQATSAELAAQGCAQRLGCQFHWLNDNYESFDHFLAQFNSRKRKNLNKERRRVAEQGLTLVAKPGGEISRDEWRRFYLFYHLTYLKRMGRQGYLNEDFFLHLADTMPEHIVMVIAYRKTEMVAAALFFKGDDVLYGRYWGCEQEFEYLHFEACYYQGIEYAIAHNMQRFDPGAQGEHKIQRGFTPVETRSNHWIARADFRQAINEFLQREGEGNRAYMDAAAEYLPFKRSS